MSKTQPYKVMVEVLAKSKARFLKFFPIKSLVEGEEYEISFKVKNISEKVFPGGEILFRIDWPSQQSTWMEFPIPPLRRNQIFHTPKLSAIAFSTGYGLIYVDKYDVKNEQGKSEPVEFYSRHGRGVVDIKKMSIYGIKSRSWEEIYEFQALIIATISLAIIAMEKISTWLMSLIK